MSERQTPAIVLTVRDYGEADLLVTFLTPDRPRGTRHAAVHCLEPLSRVLFSLSPKPGRDLEFLQRGELVKSFPSLRRDLKRLGAAALLSEVAGLLAGPPDALQEIFATLEDALTLPVARVSAPPARSGGLPAPPPPLRGLRRRTRAAPELQPPPGRYIL